MIVDLIPGFDDAIIADDVIRGFDDATIVDLMRDWLSKSIAKRCLLTIQKHIHNASMNFAP